MTFSTNWTHEDDDSLRAMWAKGISASKIGRELGRSKSSVIGRAHRMDLDARKSPIRPRDPSDPAPVRLPVFRLPTLPSLRKPAHNALPPPPPDKRDLVVRLLTEGRSNVAVVEASGLNISEVRKIRGTIEVPKRARVISRDPDVSRDKFGQERPRVFSSPAMDFIGSDRKIDIWRTKHGERFMFGQSLERRRLTGNVPTAADIAAHIARHGVTQCPTAAASATTASIPAHDQMAVAAYQQARDEDWAARNVPWNRRGMMAAKRAAEMRR